jgi:hypothetical protein
MLIAAGLAAVAGLFLPLIVIQRGPVRVGLTAMELSFHLDKTRALLDKEFQIPPIADRRIPADWKDARDDARTAADASRGAAAAFLPGLLIGALAAIALLRGKVGRFSGALALLLGLASAGAWIGLRFVIRYAIDEIELKKTELAMSYGGWCLLGIGILGVLAGIGALARPDK